MTKHRDCPVVVSSVDVRAEQYQNNRSSWVAILKRFEDALLEAAGEGSAPSLERHQKRGQLLGGISSCCDRPFTQLKSV